MLTSSIAIMWQMFDTVIWYNYSIYLLLQRTKPANFFAELYVLLTEHVVYLKKEDLTYNIPHTYVRNLSQVDIMARVQLCTVCSYLKFILVDSFPPAE